MSCRALELAQKLRWVACTLLGKAGYVVLITIHSQVFCSTQKGYLSECLALQKDSSNGRRFKTVATSTSLRDVLTVAEAKL